MITTSTFGKKTILSQKLEFLSQSKIRKNKSPAPAVVSSGTFRAFKVGIYSFGTYLTLKVGLVPEETTPAFHSYELTTATDLSTHLT